MEGCEEVGEGIAALCVTHDSEQAATVTATPGTEGGDAAEETDWPVPECPLREAVEVRTSPLGGQGLFALRDFAAGDGNGICFRTTLPTSHTVNVCSRAGALVFVRPACTHTCPATRGKRASKPAF